ncbi:response regulator [Kocuria rosea]|uniref:response regulator n=1 Tax=Kocuria rosea TaxID=1275 RepID=UPI00301B0225
MTADQLTGFVVAMTGLLDSILWPAFWLFLALYFGPRLLELLDSFDIDTPAGKFSIKLRQLEVAAALGAADAQKAKSTNDSPSRIGHVASTALRSMQEFQARRRPRQTILLWVDDHPENNLYERQAFEALGLRVEIARSTDEALSLMRRKIFALIISDMGRGTDRTAGYTLLARVRELGSNVPFLIYAGERTPEHIAEAGRRGAQGSTNSPSELMQMVTEELSGKLFPMNR